jgi:hypothetical protein
MPKKPTDFSKTILYKLVCNDLNVTECYVGHTTHFIKRRANHKNRCCNTNDKFYNLKVYKLMRETGGWENWTMVQIEHYPCNNRNEAGARERYWYELLNSNMNTQVPNRTLTEYMTQYYQDNREDRLLKRHKYYQKNREDILLKAKEKFKCECGGKYTYQNKTTHCKSKRHQKYILNNNTNIEI